MADNVTGIVLDIPANVLQNIKNADKAIKDLEQTSKKAAENIKRDFDTTMVNGVDAFIKKVQEAQTKLGNVKINLSVNDNGLSSLVQTLSQNIGNVRSISQALSQMSPHANTLALNLANVSEQIKKAFPYEAGRNIDQLSTAIKNINDRLKDEKGGVKPRADEQYLVNLRARYQEELKILETSDKKKQEVADREATRQARIAEKEAKDNAMLNAQRRKAFDDYEKQLQRKEAAQQRELEKQSEIGRRRNEDYHKQVEQEKLLDAQRRKAMDAYEKRAQSQQQRDDRTLLAEQNRLLNERLKIQKQLGNLAVAETKNTILGQKPLTADQMGLKSDLLTRIAEIDKRLGEIGARYDALSPKAQKAFDTRNMQSYIAWQQETIKNEENFAKARVRANELLSSQQKSGLQPTSQELSVQRQLTTLYAQKLNIEKEIQQVNDKIALSGRSANAAQQQYLNFLTTGASKLQTEINRVGQGYANISNAAKNNYTAEWMRMQEKAAYDLAQAQEQVNKARKNEDIQKKLAEYKQLVNENEKLAAAMRKYAATSGTPLATDTSVSAQAYRNMEAQWQANEARRRQLSQMNITEIAEFERQVQLKKDQDVLSSFAQAEAQKKMAALQRINEESAARKSAYEKYLTTYEGATKYASKDARTDTYQKREIAIKNLEAALKNLSTSDSNYAQKQQNLITILNRLKDAQKAVNDEMNRKPAITSAAVLNAASVAQNTGKLKDYQKAYEQLKAAMANTKYGTDEWNKLNTALQQTKTKIDEIKKKMGEFKSQASQVGDIAGQLKRTLAATFSISAITEYINKLIETRAQFELQQTALRAILQDKQEADKIFQQVQQMALQSPFSIMQMTTFTKQLAAYRIESEKLVGTTKMLADVSAGLGVDMGRLILAYGQVKAANYLRATEVRQFTEAGLNIAGELATYFSELQGKMISVGDVMEMITKRMVRFEDVEEVFKRVTSAGGLFYDMQKKQSETLWGQLQRIKDAMSIMFNEIGKSNQSAISGMLQLIRSLINNWRVIANLLNGASWALVAYAAKSTMAAIATGTFNTSQKGLVAALAKSKTALLSFTKFLSANPYILAITGIVALGGALLDYRKKVNATKEAYDEMIVTLTGKSEKIESLASKVADANKKIESSQQAMRNNKVGTDEYTAAVETNKQALVEQNRVLQELRTNFPEVYRQVVQNKDGIVDMTKALNDFNEAVRMQTVITTLQSDRGGWFNDDFSEDMKEISESQAKYDAQMAKATASLNAYFAKAEAIYATQKATGELSEEDALRFERIIALKNSQLSVEEKIRTIVSTGYRFKDNFISDLIQDVINLDNAYKSIGTGKKAYISKALREDTEEAKKEVDNLLQDVLTSAGVTSTEMFAKLPEATKKQTAIALNGFITDLGLSLDEAQKKLLMANLFVPLKITPVWEQGEVSQQLSFLQDKINKYIDKNKIGSFVAKTTATDNTDQYFKTLIQQYRAGVAEMQQLENAKTDIVAQGNKKRIAELKKEQAERVKLFEEFGVDYLTKAEKRGTRSRQKDIWTPRLNLMQKVNKEYEKLLKYYSKEEAMARIRTSYGDAVAEAFKGTQWADISKWGGFDAQATIDRLKQLATKAGKDAKKKILEAVGTLQAELDIKIEEKKIQEVKDKIQNLFDNYELTKTLGGLGLNIDLTYLVGGRPVKLEDVRRQLEKELSDVKATGGEEDTVKAYEDALRKVTDLEKKNAVERLKNYNKYLLESMSERVRIELKAQQEISKIRQDATLDDFSKEQAINNVRKKMQEDLTKYDFDQFKGSDVYLQTFKDLESASKTQLQYVIDKLKELSAVNKNLSPLQVKSIAQEIKKAEDALGDKAAVSSMFSNLSKAIQYAKHRNELLNKQVQIQKQLDDAQVQQSDAEKILYDLTTRRDAIQDKTSQQWIDANNEVEKQRAELLVLNNIVKQYQDNLKGVTDQISAGEAAWNNFRGAMGKVNDYLGAISEAIGSISEGLDSMGLMTDSMRDGFESASEILGGLSKMMQGLESIDISKPFSIISGVGRTIGGLFSTIGGFFGIGDKKKERQIQRLQDKVEDLQKAYEKLQTAIEESYAFNDYKAGYNQSLKNLEEQKKAIQEQINLENSKKKKDKEKLKEWNDALEDINEKEKELRNQFYEDWGSYGTDNLRNAGEEFVSAWLDAFKETGDGLDALNDKWDEFFENLVLKQAASAVVNKRLGKYIKNINAVLDKEGLSEMETSQKIKEIIESAKGEADGINAMLKEWFGSLGIKGGSGELLLSDLQKGIQNITEPQAAAIEAYLNSMRFAVFEQNNILTQMLSAIQAQYGSNDNSPMLQEVRAIRSLVASIDDRLSKVIVQRSSVSSNYMVKVG